MPWKELTKIALLGTDRTAIPVGLKKQLEALGIDPGTDAAEMVLKGAAILQARKRAGIRPSKWTSAIPQMDETVKENHCSPLSTKHLQLILDGTRADAFQEFIGLMNINQKTLTPRFLPVILERALDDGQLRDSIIPLIGARGQWLSQQNSKWAAHFCKASIADWGTADTNTRIAGFSHLRADGPEAALRLLETIWAELNHKDKIAFLQKMSNGLNAADEPFLENCLYESRKDVRQVAAGLLARLPQSQLNERMWERLSMYIQFNTTGKKPLIALPDNIDETMIRDGIDPRHQWKSGGLKASRLGQMMAIIPPDRWEKAYQKTPLEIISLFLQSDWAVLFLQAFSQAAILHKNKFWKEALLQLWIKNNAHQIWFDFQTETLLKSLDADSFNKLCQLALKVNPDFSNEEGPLYLMIRSSQHLWSNALSKLLIRSFQRWMAQQTSSHWGSWHFRTILKKAAYHSAIEVQAELRKSWPTNAQVWSAWQRDIEGFLSTLQFRKEMNEELKKQP